MVLFLEHHEDYFVRDVLGYYRNKGYMTTKQMDAVRRKLGPYAEQPTVAEVANTVEVELKARDELSEEILQPSNIEWADNLWTLTPEDLDREVQVIDSDQMTVSGDLLNPGIDISGYVCRLSVKKSLSLNSTLSKRSFISVEDVQRLVRDLEALKRYYDHHSSGKASKWAKLRAGFIRMIYLSIGFMTGVTVLQVIQ